MKKLALGHIQSASVHLQRLLSTADIEIANSSDPFSKVSSDYCDDARKSLKSTKFALADFDVPVFLSQIGDLIEKSSMRKGPTYDMYSYRLNAILSVLGSELDMKAAFCVNRDSEEYISPKNPVFGKKVELSFPSASFDIQEAAVCFGLGRDTAAVFHLMRTVEIGVRAVSTSLGLPDPTGMGRNWGQMNGSISSECERRTKAKLWSSDEEKSFYHEVHASIDAVRVAWRNSTMHVEKRYTHDEAEQILFVTKGFMRKLADRIDESGANT